MDSTHFFRSQGLIEIAAKTTLSVIPVGGTLITCIWDSVKANAAEKRMNEWKGMLESRLTKIEETIDAIGNNEVFASSIMRATDSALKTMEHEKREYLANAVINSIHCPYDESIVMIFLEMIDRYSLWHLQILDYFSNPTRFPQVKLEEYTFSGSPSDALRKVYPEIVEHRDILDRIIKDLYNDNLLNTSNINAMMSPSGIVASRTTEFGNNFISFFTNKES